MRPPFASTASLFASAASALSRASSPIDAIILAPKPELFCSAACAARCCSIAGRRREQAGLQGGVPEAYLPTPRESAQKAGEGAAAAGDESEEEDGNSEEF